MLGNENGLKRASKPRVSESFEVFDMNAQSRDCCDGAGEWCGCRCRVRFPCGSGWCQLSIWWSWSYSFLSWACAFHRLSFGGGGTFPIFIELHFYASLFAEVRQAHRSSAFVLR